MKILLQHKIFVGYFLLMAIIGCMVAIVLHERKRVAEIERESITIFQTQSNINTTHRYITVLATLGESVMTWTEKDRESYHARRLKADSLLQVLRGQCKEFVRPEQVDSLRSLLLNKEEHLFQMKEIFQQHTSVATQKEQHRNIETHADSLRLRNRELNIKLRSLIISLDEQALLALQTKETRLKKSYEYSTLVITGLIIFAIILLVVSYFIIQRDIREKARHDELMDSTVQSLQENIAKNKQLIEARKRTIQTITHELRTPLASIVGNAELIESDKKTERLQHLGSIQLSAKRMAVLLDNLMNFFSSG